jgi:2,5-diamino-6-(ribosylamino)-4(3H)-pyrimidinone 5'-phosphate reductase
VLPRVLCHLTASLDGRIDWIDPDLDLYYSIPREWGADCMVTGADTILAAPGYQPDERPDTGPLSSLAAFEGQAAPVEDRPAAEPAPLPGAGEHGPSRESVPRLVVVDSRGRLRNWRFLQEQPFWRAPTALCSRATPPEYLAYLEERRVPTIVAGDDRVDLCAALQVLAEEHGVRRVHVDSGGSLHSLLLREGLVGEVSLLVEPVLVGGSSPRWWFRAPDLAGPEGAIELALRDVRTVGRGVVWLRYEVVAPAPGEG